MKTFVHVLKGAFCFEGIIGVMLLVPNVEMFGTQQHILGFATSLYDYVLVRKNICN